MNKFILIVQIVIAIFLIICILIQSQSSGLGSSFGSNSGAAYRSKRGMEKIIFMATIVLAVFFLLLSIINII